MNNTREEYIDIYRGIGILCMIIGHVYIGYIFDKFIHAFHMPMFFFVTGYFFSINKYNSFVIKKIKTLLVPYCFFGVLSVVVYCFIERIDLIGTLKHLFWVNTEGLYDVGAVWFLTALFWASLMYFSLRRYINNEWILHIIVALISVAGNSMSICLEYRLPWALEASCVAMGFIHLGYLVRHNAETRLIKKLLNIKPFVLLPFMLVVSFLIFTNGYVNMRTGEYSNILLFWIVACLSIIVLWNIAKILCACKNEFIICGCKVLQYIGRNSITFLCLNQIIIYILVKSLPIFNIYIRKIIVFAITLIMLFLFTELLLRTKLKVLIGRF